MRGSIAVVDRKALAVIGFVMGGITAAILTLGAVVVQRHLDGRLTLARSGQAENIGTAHIFRHRTMRAELGGDAPDLALLIPRTPELRLAIATDPARL